MIRAAAILITLHCALAFPQAFNSTSNATFIATSCDEGDNCYDMRMQNVAVRKLARPHGDLGTLLV